MRSALATLIFIGKYSLLLVVVSIVFWFVKWRIGRRRLYKLAAEIEPGVIPKLPGIGIAWRLAKDVHKFNDWATKMAKGPELSTYWIGPILVISTTRPEDYKIVLKNPDCLEKGMFYKFLAAATGDSIITAPAHCWKHKRQIAKPAFSGRTLGSFMDTFNIAISELVEKLQESQETLDIVEPVALCSIRISLETLIGIEVSQEECVQMLRGVVKAQRLISERMVNIFMYPDFLYRFTDSCRKLHEYDGYIMKIFYKLVLRKMKQMKSEQDRDKEIEDGTAVLLDLMASAKEKGDELTDDDIVIEMKTMMVGSYDTSSKTFAYFCLCLALNPDVQDKLYQEAKEVLGEDRNVAVTDFSKFVYLDKVIKETLRVFPAIPIIVRHAAKDVDLGDRVIPAGAEIYINILETHRSEKFYPDPFKFDPERFSPEEVAKRNPYTYLPFSHGPRNCIGFQYAMHFLKVLVPRFILKFKIETTLKDIREVKFHTDVFLDSSVGYPIKLIGRS